jgi:hypothetical protein
MIVFQLIKIVQKRKEYHCAAWLHAYALRKGMDPEETFTLRSNLRSELSNLRHDTEILLKKEIA